ncbi:major facilitator superfamily domain-containing protein [Aspergillus floccosus]
MEVNQDMSPPSTPRPPHTIFTSFQKTYIIFMASGAGFFSSVSAPIYFPALNVLAEDLGVTTALINLTLTSYMIVQGISPMFLGTFADNYGRRPAYIICFVIYIAANVGLALQSNFVALLLLRCVQSAGCSSTISLAAAVVADVSTKEDRGSYMGLVMAGSYVGTAVGPVFGGLLTQYLGWKSIFWFLTITSAVFFLALLLFFPETARNVVGNGSSPPQNWNRPLMHYLYRRRTVSQRPATSDSSLDQSIPLSTFDQLPKKDNNPRKPSYIKSVTSIFQKRSIFLLIATGVMFASYMLVNAAIPSTFDKVYALNNLQVGLCYLPIGLGAILSVLGTGKLLDSYYRRLKAEAAKSISNPESPQKPVSIEKARCTIGAPLGAAGALAVLAFGWVLNFDVHLAAPVTFLFFVSLALNGAFNCSATLLVDFHPSAPATATAMNNLFRGLMSAGATAFLDPMLNGMGRGWGFTLVAVVVMGTAVMLALLGWMYQRGEEDDADKGDDVSVDCVVTVQPSKKSDGFSDSTRA